MAFVHLQNGSVTVSVGQNITKGMVIGNVGHSGNSTSPHLHFQVMDTSDIGHAKVFLAALKNMKCTKQGDGQRCRIGYQEVRIGYDC